MPTEIVLAAVIALALGLVAGWLVWGRAAAEFREKFLAAIRDVEGLTPFKAEAERLRAIEIEHARFKAAAEERDRQHSEQLAALETRFAGLAQQVLDKSHDAFIQRADETLKLHRLAADEGLQKNKAALGEMLTPVQDVLKRYETRLAEIELARTESYGRLTQMLDSVGKGQERVSLEASKLASVLRSSGKAAGRWGEEQCRNVLEQAGLVEGVDFTAQSSVASDAGRQLPDFTVYLPGDRRLVIDVKCSLDAYALAAEAENDEERDRHLRAHAAAIRAHAKGLSGKSYEKAVDGAVDFVVMYVHGENFLATAMSHDRTLMADFMAKRVVLAGPINLIAIARTVAAMRDQARLAEQAAQIAKLGRELYDSIRIMGNNVGAVHKNLSGTIDSWNRLVGQMESRVLGRARKFETLGATTGIEAIGDMPAIEKVPLLPNAPELLPPAEAAE